MIPHTSFQAIDPEDGAVHTFYVETVGDDWLAQVKKQKKVLREAGWEFVTREMLFPQAAPQKAPNGRPTIQSDRKSKPNEIPWTKCQGAEGKFLKWAEEFHGLTPPKLWQVVDAGTSYPVDGFEDIRETTGKEYVIELVRQASNGTPTVSPHPEHDGKEEKGITNHKFMTRALLDYGYERSEAIELFFDDVENPDYVAAMKRMDTRVAHDLKRALATLEEGMKGKGETPLWVTKEQSITLVDDRHSVVLGERHANLPEEVYPILLQRDGYPVSEILVGHRKSGKVVEFLPEGALIHAINRFMKAAYSDEAKSLVDIARAARAEELAEEGAKEPVKEVKEE